MMVENMPCTSYISLSFHEAGQSSYRLLGTSFRVLGSPRGMAEARMRGWTIDAPTRFLAVRFGQLFVVVLAGAGADLHRIGPLVARPLDRQLSAELADIQGDATDPGAVRAKGVRRARDGR